MRGDSGWSSFDCDRLRYLFCLQQGLLQRIDFKLQSILGCVARRLVLIELVMSPIQFMLQVRNGLFGFSQVLLNARFLTLYLTELFKHFSSMCFVVLRFFLLLPRYFALIDEFLVNGLNLLSLLAHEILQVRAELLFAQFYDLIIVDTQLCSIDLVDYCRHHFTHTSQLTRQVLCLITDTTEFVPPSDSFVHPLIPLRLRFALGGRQFIF